MFATGNGCEPPAPVADTPGQPAPTYLGESLVRLQAQPLGNLAVTDFFIPFDAVHLNVNDGDLASGAPVILPSQFSTPTHPKLIVEIGKEGYLYVIDASHFGGWQQGIDEGDNVLARLGPVQGVWGDPTVWTGDGGYLYFVANGGAGADVPGPTEGHLLAWKFGVDGSGNPTFAEVGQSTDTFAYGSSSPVVTSNGTTSGSAVLWVNWAPAEYSPNGQLRAYNPIPDPSGNLDLLWSAPSGTAAKLSTPGVGNNRVYIGGVDGILRGYGSPVQNPLTGGGLQFPDTTLGASSTLQDTVTATEPLTITGISVSGPGFTGGPLGFNLPITLNPSNPNLPKSVTGPVHFAPVNYGTNGGTITFTTSKGTYAVGLQGNGLSASALLTETPAFLTFEGTAIDTTVTHDVILNNQGSKPLKITSISTPAAPFSATDLPAIGTTIAPGASVGVVITYAPINVGQYSSGLTVNSDTGGSVTLDLSGTAGNPGVMTVTPTTINFPSIPVGSTETESFTVSNTGGSVLTINKSHYPVGGTFIATTALNEGSQLQPGQVLTETVKFAPTTAGTFTDQWILNGDGNSNLTYVTFHGTSP